MGSGNQSSTLSRLPSQGLGGNDDLVALKQRISTLELENKHLKDQQDKDNSKRRESAAVTNDDRNWMQSFGASSGAGGAARQMTMADRPQTASSQNARVREVQEELKKERKDKQKLLD